MSRNAFARPGTSVAVIDDRHASVNPPSLAIVDIRHGAKGIDGIERLRASWPTATIFAIASTAQPEQILQAMRAGANEYLSWPIDESFNAAIHRAAERSRPKEGTRNSCVLSFFGVKGGAGTTTVAVNTAIEIARISKKPTLIIDLHQFIGEVALFLGVRPRFTLVDALDNLHRIDTEFLRELVVKHKTGLDILAGGEQADRPGPQDAVIFEQLLQTLGRSYDYIIIDGGLVTGPCSDVAVFAADSMLSRRESRHRVACATRIASSSAWGSSAPTKIAFACCSTACPTSTRSGRSRSRPRSASASSRCFRATTAPFRPRSIPAYRSR